jgi:hypothetical protein
MPKIQGARTKLYIPKQITKNSEIANATGLLLSSIIEVPLCSQKGHLIFFVLLLSLK